MTMPAFNVGDDWHDHPKVLAVGNAAAGLWTRMGSYASRYLTDGFVPNSVAARMGTPSQISRLLKVGLLDPNSDGYIVHDYLDANRSRAAVIADREAATVRQRRSRAAARAVDDDVSRRDARRSHLAAAASQPAELASLAAAAAAAGEVTPSPAGAAALEIYVGHRIAAEGRNVRSPSKYAATIRRAEMARLGPELADVDPDDDPIEVCIALFGITKSDAIRAQIARERETNGEMQ